MYFVYRDGKYIDASWGRASVIFWRPPPALPGEKPTIADWNDHLSTAFPGSALEKFPRNARRRRRDILGPHLCARLLVRLLYDQVCARWRGIVKGWSMDEAGAARFGAEARPCRAGSGRADAEGYCGAGAGHRAFRPQRARLDASGNNETGYLAALQGICHADKLRRNHCWSGIMVHGAEI